MVTNPRVGRTRLPDRAAAQTVRLALEAKYPEADATEVWLRKRESDRDVVAVLYRERDSRTFRKGMPLYRMFAIRRDLTTEELTVDPDSPYSIRGIK